MLLLRPSVSYLFRTSVDGVYRASKRPARNVENIFCLFRVFINDIIELCDVLSKRMQNAYQRLFTVSKFDKEDQKCDTHMNSYTITYQFRSINKSLIFLKQQSQMVIQLKKRTRAGDRQSKERKNSEIVCQQTAESRSCSKYYS